MNEHLIAYIDSNWSETLCAEHGKVRNDEIKAHCAENDCDAEDCELFPITNWNNEELSCVEYCAAGHGFCGICGSDMSDAEDVNGGFAECVNCSTASVYVDGVGYVYVGSFGEMLEYVNITLTGFTLGLLTDMIRMTPITGIMDNTRSRGLRPFYVSVAHAPMFPEYGAVLLLSNESDGMSAALSYFEDQADMRDEDDEFKTAITEDVVLISGLRTRDDLIFESR